MSVFGLVLRCLLIVALVFNGTASSMAAPVATAHPEHHASEAPAKAHCHHDHLDQAAGHHESEGKLPGATMPDCCKAGLCDCACSMPLSMMPVAQFNFASIRYHIRPALEPVEPILIAVSAPPLRPPIV